MEIFKFVSKLKDSVGLLSNFERILSDFIGILSTLRARNWAGHWAGKFERIPEDASQILRRSSQIP